MATSSQTKSLTELLLEKLNIPIEVPNWTNKQTHMMFEIAHAQGLYLTYDDVLLAPQYSEILPHETNVETMLSQNIKLKIPLISSDMDTVTESRMARQIAMLGGFGFLWKHPDMQVQGDWVDEVKYTFNKLITNPVTIDQNASLEDIMTTLAHYNNKFSTLIVLDSDKKVVGLVTDDLTRFANKDDKVSSFMRSDVVTTTAKLDERQAYDFMKERRVGKLILVDESNQLTGMYTFKDVQAIVENQTPMYNRDSNGQLRVGASIGVNTPALERAEYLLGKHCDVLLISTAHGDTKNVIETVRKVRENFGSKYEFDIIAGNVATKEGAYRLIEAGANGIKVGVGPGSICTTRIISGAGSPQLSAIREVTYACHENGIPVIADGGIRYSGDIVKALAAGADSCMMGSLFASTEESPGRIFIRDGEKFKVYRGMGSEGAMKDNGGQRYGRKDTSGKVVAEGVEGAVRISGSVEDAIFQLIGGLHSGMGYTGAPNLEELRKRAHIIRITSSGMKESHPHDLAFMNEASNYRK